MSKAAKVMNLFAQKSLCTGSRIWFPIMMGANSKVRKALQNTRAHIYEVVT